MYVARLAPVAKCISRLNQALFSSKTAEWETPQAFFDLLNAQYHFETDVCATHENAKCKHYFTKEEDGLSKDWQGVCWMNPPYGREIGAWVKKAYFSFRQGATVVCLLPARTDTAWFHDYVKDKAEITFIRGRLKFGNAANSAPFPSMVAVYRPE